MRCRETRMLLYDLLGGQLPAAAAEHLRSCSACQAYEREWRLVRAGFRALAEVSAPEASTGFAARVVRRLGDVSLPARVAAQFWELVGRRVVLVGSLVALAVAMALTLPSSGPLRTPAPVDLSLLQSDAATESDPVLGDDFVSRPSSLPHQPTGEERKKQ